MQKTDGMMLFNLIHKFFIEYLPNRRGFSEKTVESYRYTFNDYRRYLEETKGKRLSSLTFDDFAREPIYQYLMHLRSDKKNKNSTLNVRLAAFCSFLKFCSEENVSLAKYFMDVSGIHSFKNDPTKRLEYLTPAQLKKLLGSFDVRLRKERRNRFLVLFLYETGCRVQEVLDLRLSSITFEDKRKTATVRVLGKGSKTRIVPLTEETVVHLKAYLDEFNGEAIQDLFLFYTNHDGLPTKMKAGSVDAMLKTIAARIREEDPSFPENLHAHCLRHSLAMNLYRKGIPLSYIRDILGHSSIDTTSIYAHADNETKLRALEKAAVVQSGQGEAAIGKKWKGKESSLLTYCGLN